MFEPLHVRAYKGYPVRPLDDIDFDPAYRAPSSYEEPQTSKLDVAWVWRAIAQRWKLIAATVLVFLIPSIVYVQLAEPVYRSTAVIQINSNNAHVLPYNDPLESGGVTDYELTMKTYDGILKSHALRQRVIDRFKDSPEGALVPNLEEALAANPTIERVEGSQLVSLSYMASNPTFAAAAANAWVEELIAMEAENQIKKAEEATGFLRSQLASLKVQVEQAEANLTCRTAAPHPRPGRELGEHRAPAADPVDRRIDARRGEPAVQRARHGSLTKAAQGGMQASLNKPG
ncbi:MAG: Wzz/FepE/Etk N-terminal domain-containing protein [Bryobacterales bacterium]